MTCEKPNDIVTLQAQVRSLDFRVRQKDSQGLSEHNRMLNLMTMLGIGQLTLDDEGRYVSAGIGIRRLLSASGPDVPVAELFGTASARRYFEALRNLRQTLQALPERMADAPWSRVFPDPDSDAGLEDWHRKPKDGWEIKGATARSMLCDAAEYHLCSSRLLIGRTDDFRVCYTARANGFPADLSMVVGARLDIQRAAGEQRWRPETNGYCFAFGLYSNSGSALQRSYRDVVPLADVCIQPEKDHHCVAERIGGQLRFEVDGEEAFRTLDLLPLMYEDHGYVSFYCCAAGSVFSDATVFTRPTGLDADTLARIESLRKATVETAAGSRQVNLHYAGGRTFLVQEADKRLRPDYYSCLITAVDVPPT